MTLILATTLTNPEKCRILLAIAALISLAFMMGLNHRGKR